MTEAGRRPRLHLTARAGWVNDPLGLTFHEGRYHLFFQHLPDRLEWAPDCHWGHATSDDLLHWQEHPVAVTPEPGEGAWSGCLVVPEGGPATILYTSVDTAAFAVGRVRAATTDDPSWKTWTRGPVVAGLPEGVPAVTYRDPQVLRHGDRWRMIVGAGLADGTATALAYSSDDLTTWSYDGLLASRSGTTTAPVWTGDVWECPQLFELDGTWVLVVSVWSRDVTHYVAYATGHLDGAVFEADAWHRLTYGPAYYAAATFLDADAGRGLVHWLRGVGDGKTWAGAVSIPHAVRLDGGRLVAEPHRSLTDRRGRASVLEGGTRQATTTAACDVGWVLDPIGSSARLVVRAPDGTELFRLVAGGGGLSASAGSGSWSMPLSSREVRVVLDGPVCEVFCADGVLAFAADSPPGGRLVRIEGATTATVHDLG